ncbi:MAG: L,D-transpeptidase [Shimia sp.]
MQYSRRGALTLLAGTFAAGALPVSAQTVYQVPAHHMPTMVEISPGFRPGDIHVDPRTHALFLIMGGNRAVRYAVGMGKAGQHRSGTFRIGRMAANPRWTPTAGMIRREPALYRPFAAGIPGGHPRNPMGTRALYLYAGQRDTLLRIHGTPAPWSIGKNTTNGCIQLVNSHVEHLYDHVGLGARVVIH